MAIFSLLVATLVTAASRPGLARDKYETIGATIYGTSTDMGKNIGITLIIYQWSTPEDRQVLVDAFYKGQTAGLVSALQKMKPVGRIQIPGTVGYDVGYIELIPQPTGRKIRFITNRKILFGEAFMNSETKSYDLTAGEFYLDDQKKNKSTGMLYPACQLIVNSEGELQFNLFRNPWRVAGFIDWKATVNN
jgi:hypothetical protein